MSEKAILNSAESDPVATCSQVERRGHTALLRLCGNFFENIRDLARRDEMLNAFDSLSNDPDVKVIIVSAAFCGVGVDAYVRFFREQRGKVDKQSAHRFCNAINQVLLDLVRSGKLVVNAGGGHMLAFFLGMALASDYSIASEDSVYHNSYLDMGMLPKGALPYFITRKLGSRAVYELLLAEKEIPAREALRKGLIDLVVPVGQVEEAAFSYAAKFEHVQMATITGTKRLTNWCIRDLEEFLSYENKQILKALDQVESLE